MAAQIINEARRLAQTAKTWAELSNAIFDPIEGLIAKAYPSLEQRKAFGNTEEYRQLRELVKEAMDRTGVIAGAGRRVDVSED